MRWSQLKKRIEETFAERVKGRVEVFVTRYRHAHDGAGEAWVTIDGAQVSCMSEIAYWKHRMTLHKRIMREAGAPERPDYRDAELRRTSWEAHDRAEQTTLADEVYSDEAFKEALFDYLNLSIEEILASENPIIRAFGMLDRRMGKRRLAAFEAKKETALLRRLHAFRCEVEGVAPLTSRECS